MLHDWPYQEDCLTAEGFVVLPPQADPEPPPARTVRVRTHCAEGHAFDRENTLITATGRRCLICLRARWLPARARRTVAGGKYWAQLPRRP